MVVRSDGDVLCAECRVASKFSTRFRGLLGLGKLPPSRGVLLSRTNFIHTHFMRFPIDAVFLDRDLGILNLVEGLRPWRMARCPDAEAVLELAAGTARYARLRVGEQLALVSGKVEERRGQAIRVALSTPDRRFHRVASFLLSRDGFTVEGVREPEDVDRLARDGKVDVVLLDATDSVRAALRATRSLEAVAPDVGVVLLVDGEANGKATDRLGGHLETVPKWGSFDTMVDAVERSFAAFRLDGLA